MTEQEPEAPAWGSAAPPPPPPPAALPPMYQQVTGDQTHQGALWSMILGIVGLVAAVLSLPTSGITAPGIVCSPIAFGLGLWASRATAARPDLYKNRGMALAGWIMGLIGMLLVVISLVVIALFIGLLIWLFSSVEA
ncbi:hypothetical protein DJ010_15860 [Nocardioides silvaticus]|uniref:DUF4190 domain-containing protein n=1 Tax=Nocardioides silvaticus TaxID=2201891 RepID=A0A316TQZ6_9ACTN|nr:hypothetical protein [Nocardioides silvaticus]PWN02006.1 hypothetical protein DJ010_15860 [Nocardioides silvaticus]